MGLSTLSTNVVDPASASNASEDFGGFITLTTDVLNFTATSANFYVDVPLSQPISLTNVRHILGEATQGTLTRLSGTAEIQAVIWMGLVANGQVVLWVQGWQISTQGDSFTFISRFSRTLQLEDVATLPVTTVDAVTFEFILDDTAEVTIESIHADGKVRAHFAGCEFSPCGPHEQQVFVNLPGLIWTAPGPSPWQTYSFGAPVAGDGLRLVSGPQFAYTVFGSATSEAQLLIDDGTFVTLDDWQAPSTLTAPTNLSSGDHSLGLAGDVLAGRLITGFRWRINLTGSSADYTPLNPLIISFLFEDPLCESSIPVPPEEVSPEDGSVFPIGSQITITGRAFLPDANRPISTILINDEPVDSIDASGNFFKTAQIQEGVNLFIIKVFEPGCIESQDSVTLVGAEDADATIDQLSDITVQMATEYANTTFNRATNALSVDTSARNVSGFPVSGPVTMTILSQENPAVFVANPIGIRPDGAPYFSMLLPGDQLQSGELGTPVLAAFGNPSRQKILYDLAWESLGNRPPQFSTAPPTTVEVPTIFLYQVEGFDPDGDPITFALEMGPAGMTVDSGSGLVQWSPLVGDLGAHEVELAVRDDRGGRTSQGFTITVVDAGQLFNRAPVFSSVPDTHVSIGAQYEYDADAQDLDQDVLTFALPQGPAELTIDPVTGLVQGTFMAAANHTIAISVQDGQGGQAVQQYVLTVGDVSSNPAIPAILSAPPAVAVVSQLYVYQPVVSNPDGDVLTFSLDVGPAGMGIDPFSGRMTWTPDAGQIGLQSVSWSVTDAGGNAAQQSYEINVLSNAPNLPPVFQSTAPLTAVVGEPYVYQASAADPEMQIVTFGLVAGPSGMSLDPATGIVTWMPATAGQEFAVIQATTAQGPPANQAFPIDVRASNAPPTITSTPVTQVTAGGTYRYGVAADDPDGDPLTFELAQGPVGMTIHATTGVVTWQTASVDVGMYPVVVAVEDCCQGRAEQSYQLTVGADGGSPVVQIGFSQVPAPVGVPITVSVLATDDVGVQETVLTVECDPGQVDPLELDVFRQAVFVGGSPGLCTFEATATDTSGNQSIAIEVLQVGDPGAVDPFPPVFELVGPAPNAIVTGPIDIVASITDDTQSGPGSDLSWTVKLSRRGSAASRVVGQGSGEVQNLTIASIDPTLLPNDVYDVEVRVVDGFQSRVWVFPYSICGEYKLGNFSMTLTDLVIPLAGIPLVVLRQYDSLDTSTGDFGAGWRLGLVGDISDSAAESPGLEPFSTATRVYVTRPDGLRVGFTATFKRSARHSSEFRSSSSSAGSTSSPIRVCSTVSSCPMHPRSSTLAASCSPISV